MRQHRIPTRARVHARDGALAAREAGMLIFYRGERPARVRLARGEGRAAPEQALVPRTELLPGARAFLQCAARDEGDGEERLGDACERRSAPHRRTRRRDDGPRVRSRAGKGRDRDGAAAVLRRARQLHAAARRRRRAHAPAGLAREDHAGLQHRPRARGTRRARCCSFAFHAFTSNAPSSKRSPFTSTSTR